MCQTDTAAETKSCTPLATCDIQETKSAPLSPSSNLMSSLNEEEIEFVVNYSLAADARTRCSPRACSCYNFETLKSQDR
eukprot:762851-Hanusia_phi.AAC.2